MYETIAYERNSLIIVLHCNIYLAFKIKKKSVLLCEKHHTNKNVNIMSLHNSQWHQFSKSLGSRIPYAKEQFCATAMRSYVKLLWPFVIIVVIVIMLHSALHVVVYKTLSQSSHHWSTFVPA